MKMLIYPGCFVAVLMISAVVLPTAAIAQPAATGNSEIKAGELEWTVDMPPLTVGVEMAVPENARCASTVSVDYTQSDAVARLKTRIENATCAASHGSYEITLSVRDANGERRVLEFSESWSRAESDDLEFARVYPIGEDVDLLSARVRRHVCICSDE